MQITITEIQTVDDIDGQPYCRHAKIAISNNGTTYAWNVGGIPLDSDAQAYLDNMADDIWRDAEARGEAPQTEEIIQRPIRTPALYADDVFVSSRKIKDDPDDAFDEAMAETSKDGQPKSLDLISRSTLKALEQAREHIKDLRQKLKDKSDEIGLLKLDIKAMADDIKEIKKKLK